MVDFTISFVQNCPLTCAILYSIFVICYWTKLFTGTVPAIKNYVTGTVPANKSYVTGTVKKG